MKRHIATLIIIVLLAIAANTKIETNQYATYAKWNWGGVDLLPQPALFICPGWYDDHYLGHFTPNPIAPLFPDLITDC